MINELFNHLKKEFKVLEVLPQKKTARCPQTTIVEYNNSKKLVIIATTDIQKFYLKRSIENQKNFYDDFSEYFKFNFPEEYGDINNFSYAIYPYLENLKWTVGTKPLEILNELYSKKSKSYEMNDELLQKIEEDFLSAWPDEYREKIRNSKHYKEYFNKIKSLPEVQIYQGHYDYAVNNILNDGKDLYLMDFEFSKNFQPVGFDEYHYKRTLALEYKKNPSEVKIDGIDDFDDFIVKKKSRFLFFKNKQKKYKNNKNALFKIHADLIDFANNLVDKSVEQ